MTFALLEIVFWLSLFLFLFLIKNAVLIV